MARANRATCSPPAPNCLPQFHRLPARLSTHCGAGARSQQLTVGWSRELLPREYVVSNALLSLPGRLANRPPFGYFLQPGTRTEYGFPCSNCPTIFLERTSTARICSGDEQDIRCRIFASIGEHQPPGSVLCTAGAGVVRSWCRRFLDARPRAIESRTQFAPSAARQLPLRRHSQADEPRFARKIGRAKCPHWPTPKTTGSRC